MVHRIVWRVSGVEALDFWEQRLQGAQRDPARADESLRFTDPEGLEHELLAVQTPDEPLVAEHPEIPAELALQGFHAARAYTDAAARSRDLLERTLGFTPQDEATYEIRGDRRGGFSPHHPPPPA